MNKAIRIIGVPIDLGQNKRGVDMGLAALRYAGFAENNFVNALIPLVGAGKLEIIDCDFCGAV
jgi:arginase family enzyme